MRALLLALLALCAFANAYAGENLSDQLTDFDVVRDGSWTTLTRYAVAYGQLRIWTQPSYKQDDVWNDGLYQLPGDFRWFAHVSQIAMRDRQGCVINSGEVICYQANQKPGEMFGSKLKRITGALQVEVESNYACALTEEELTCWGDGSPVKSYPVYGGKSFGSASFGQQFWPDGVTRKAIGACAIDEKGLHCWNVSDDVASIPPLAHPTAVAVANGRACAIDGEKVVCWGSGFLYRVGCYDDRADGRVTCHANSFNINPRPMVATPALNHPEEVQMTDYVACARGDERVKCWSTDEFGQLPVPSLHGVKKLKRTNGAFCALADNGLTCWSYDIYKGFKPGGHAQYTLEKLPSALAGPAFYDDYQVSPFFDDLNGFSQYLSKLEKISTPARARFLGELKSYLEADLPLPAGSIESWESQQKEKVANAYARYWLLKALAPFVDSGDSQVMRTAVAPEYADSIELAQSVRLRWPQAVLHFNPNLPEKTAANRKVLLKVIQVALQVGSNFLSAEERSAVQSGLRSVGDAFANPMDEAKVAAALAQVESLPVPAKLGSNPKSAFLVQTMRQATGWLKGSTE